MRERSDAVDVTQAVEAGEPDVRGRAGRKRIDLSLPQVAGSALAAVVAAKLASSFGVYGTILGAGVVSAIATCGGTLFQHFFKRTGEQLRGASVTARPRGRLQARPGPGTVPAPGEFTEGTVYRARVRSWKRPLIAAALVFGVTMAGITTYELASGHSFSGGTSTTVGDALSGRATSSSGSDPSQDADRPGGSTSSGDPRNTPAPADSAEPGAGGGPTGGPSGTPEGGTDAGTPSGAAPSPSGGAQDGVTPAPSATAGQGSGDASSTAPSAPATAPESSADDRSGTGDPGRDGPATP